MMRQFTETQQFRQGWVWGLLIFTGILSIYDFRDTVVVKKLQHLNSLDILGVIIPVLIIVLMIVIKMETRIDGTGVYYRFFPFQLAMRKKGWDEISRVYIRIYNPLGEYGGWGIRYGIGKSGMALNIAGNQGLQLELKNGKKLLLGTQKAIELQQVLDELAAAGVISLAKEDRF